MSARYDAAVIGAGVNGLVAAAYLAKAGKRVLVLERGDRVGGSASVLHDAGWLSPQIIGDLDLASHGLGAAVPAPRLLSPMPNGGWLTIDREVSGTVAELRKHAAKDAEKWPAFTADIARVAGFMKLLYEVPPPRPQPRSMGEFMSLALVGRSLRSLGKREMIEVLRTLPMSVAELLDDWFDLDALKGALGASGVQGLLQGPRGGGTAFMFVHNQVGRPAGIFRGSAYTSAQLVSALTSALQKRAVEIRTNSGIARVRVERGRATGVVLDDGSEVDAATVLSSADPRRTFVQLVDTRYLDPEFVHAVRNIKLRGVESRVRLALSEAPAIEGWQEGDVVSISPSLDYLERAFDHAKYGRISEHPHIDARIVRNGKEYELTASVQYTPYQLRDGVWDAAQSTVLGARVIDTLNGYIPNLKSSLVAQTVTTPLDFEHQHGLTEGNVHHGELTLDQVLFMRPVAGYADYKTPIESLYLCGSGTHPGGGIAGGSGRLAARAVLND